MMRAADEANELVTVQADPFNAEAPLQALATVPTPTRLFYVRSNFAVPEIDAGAWRLRVTGAVERELEVSYHDLLQMPQVRSTVLLECAGNGRRRMVPVPGGVPWDLGAVGTAVFEGVLLSTLLEHCGIASSAVEVLFRGADSGEVQPGRTVHFERSLPAHVARNAGVMIAHRMNGEPLTSAHGYPARIVVPGWYAVASVKWLTEIAVLAKPFVGHFQTEKYRYINDGVEPEGAPVKETRVRSILTSHRDGGTARAGRINLFGLAWSGTADVTSVEVSMDGGATWSAAELAPVADDGTRKWSFAWDAQPGAHIIMCRATDEGGRSQPLTPVFNTLGYGNNVVQSIKIEVSDRTS